MPGRIGNGMRNYGRMLIGRTSMAESKASVNMKDVVKTIEVQVSLKGMAKVWPRFILGCWIVRFGAWFGGFKIVGIE